MDKRLEKIIFLMEKYGKNTFIILFHFIRELFKKKKKKKRIVRKIKLEIIIKTV